MNKPQKSRAWAVERPQKSVKTLVVYAIVDAMLDGRLKLDAPMPPEPEMCEKLGVSRVVFREAVKQLEVLGFLRIDRGNGTYVTSPTFACLESIIEFLGRSGSVTFGDLHQVRLLIEVEIVRQLAEKHDKRLVESLQQILDYAEANADKESSHLELDYKFHEALINACPNKLLSLILSPFAAQLKKSRVLSFKDIESSKKTIETHKAILRAIEEGKPDAAAALMRKHLLSTAKDLNLKGW